jgi:hypothetical protein
MHAKYKMYAQIRHNFEAFTGKRVHPTLDGLPRAFDDPPWLQTLRCLLLPRKQQAADPAELVALLVSEGFRATVEKTSVHVHLGAVQWSLAELNFHEGRLRYIFMHAH